MRYMLVFGTMVITACNTVPRSDGMSAELLASSIYLVDAKKPISGSAAIQGQLKLIDGCLVLVEQHRKSLPVFHRSIPGLNRAGDGAGIDGANFLRTYLNRPIRLSGGHIPGGDAWHDTDWIESSSLPVASTCPKSRTLVRSLDATP